MVEADEGIHFRHDARQIFGETLRQTSGDDDLLAGAVFVFGTFLDGFKDGIDRLRFRHVDERAGIDDEHVGEFGIGREGHTCLREVADHDFRVDEIFGAAERDETDSGLHGGEG